MKKLLIMAISLIIIPAIFCGCNSVKKRNSDATSKIVDTTILETVNSTNAESDINSSDLKLEGDPYCHTVSAYDYIQEFPDLNTPYLEANLPKELQNFLDTDGKFALIADEPNLLSLVEFFYNDSSNFRSTNYFAKIYCDNYSYSTIIGRPIIYYDNEEFYIEGFSLTSINKELIRYNWNSATIETIAENADLLGVSNVTEYYYDVTIDTTIKRNDDNSFSLYRLGVNHYNFVTNSSSILSYQFPFIDDYDNLIHLKIDRDNLENSKLLVIDANVKEMLNDYFYDDIGYPSFTFYLYEKNDNSYILYGHNYNYALLPKEPFYYCYHIYDLDSVFTDVDLRFDDTKVGDIRIFILHIGNVNIPNTNFTELYAILDSLYVNDVDEGVNNLLNKPFKFSERSEKIEELLTYINNN